MVFDVKKLLVAALLVGAVPVVAMDSQSGGSGTKSTVKEMNSLPSTPAPAPKIITYLQYDKGEVTVLQREETTLSNEAKARCVKAGKAVSWNPLKAVKGVFLALTTPSKEETKLGDIDKGGKLAKAKEKDAVDVQATVNKIFITENSGLMSSNRNLKGALVVAAVIAAVGVDTHFENGICRRAVNKVKSWFAGKK